MKPKKTKAKAEDSSIKKQDFSDLPLKFSFRLFDITDEEACPPAFADGYVRALMARLRDLSSWKVSEFLTPQGRSVRNHVVTWSDTARPKGFPNLNEQLQGYAAHQFSVSANERGRVHGLLIDDTFHLIWLDQNHVVYP